MNKILHLVLVLFSVTALSCASSPQSPPHGDTSIGMEKLKSDETSEAKQIFLRQCRNKDRAACIQLGHLDAKEKDATISEGYYQLACDLGSAYGCLLVGKMFYYQNDFAKALPYL